MFRKFAAVYTAAIAFGQPNHQPTRQDQVIEYSRQGQHASARGLARRLLVEAAESNAGAAYRAGLLQLLATAEHNLGNITAAVDALQQSIALSEQNGPPAAGVLVSSLASLIRIRTEQAHFDEAAQLARRAMAAGESDLPPNHLRMAPVFDALAVLYEAQGHRPRAESAYRRALAILVQHLGADHPTVAAESGALASLLASMGRPGEALPLIERSQKTLAAAYGPGHPETIQAASRLGVALIESSPASAERVLRTALANWLATRPGPKMTTAILWNALALTRHRQKDPAEALSLNNQAIDLARNLLGPEHPHVVSFLDDQAILLKAAKRGKEASALKKEAGRIRKANGYPEHGRQSPPPHAIDIRTLQER